MYWRRNQFLRVNHKNSSNVIFLWFLHYWIHLPPSMMPYFHNFYDASSSLQKWYFQRNNLFVGVFSQEMWLFSLEPQIRSHAHFIELVFVRYSQRRTYDLSIQYNSIASSCDWPIIQLISIEFDSIYDGVWSLHNYTVFKWHTYYQSKCICYVRIVRNWISTTYEKDISEW